MRILAVSDAVDERLYTPNLKEEFPPIQLVLGCGDLPYEFLEFLVSVFNVPLLYVPGNHDPEYDLKNTASRAEGCENIDRQLTLVKGLQIAGLGGSILYKPNAVNQYTQLQMWQRTASLVPRLALTQFRRKLPLDIFIAHSPPLGIHDDDDQAHTGFAAFAWLIRTFKPRYFLHGHTMGFANSLEEPDPNLTATQVINISPYRLIEVDVHV